MTAGQRSDDLDQWLGELRDHFALVAPELLGFFETYAGEARFGYRYISGDLSRLPAGSAILEVGAGSFMLACHLVREGFAVTGLEPVGEGFSHFTKMRQLVLERARLGRFAPAVLETTGEELSVTEAFDYAFSVNVMEHVTSVEKTVSNVVRSLKPGAEYRFTCANYTFPYEPHFNIPTLFSKAITEKLLGSMIFTNVSVGDPVGLWASLNWISVGQLRRLARSQPGLEMAFGKDLTVEAFERVGTDAVFAARRSPLVQKVIRALVRLNLHALLRLLPAAILPLIDCHVRRAVYTQP